MNNYELALNVPHFDREKLASSTLILADLIEKVPTKSIGTGQFVIGEHQGAAAPQRHLPARRKAGNLPAALQFQPDEKTQKPNGTVEYEITKNGTNEKIFEYTRSGGRDQGRIHFAGHDREAAASAEPAAGPVHAENSGD